MTQAQTLPWPHAHRPSSADESLRIVLEELRGKVDTDRGFIDFPDSLPARLRAILDTQPSGEVEEALEEAIGHAEALISSLHVAQSLREGA